MLYAVKDAAGVRAAGLVVPQVLFVRRRDHHVPARTNDSKELRYGRREIAIEEVLDGLDEKHRGERVRGKTGRNRRNQVRSAKLSITVCRLVQRLHRGLRKVGALRLDARPQELADQMPGATSEIQNTATQIRAVRGRKTDDRVAILSAEVVLVVMPFRGRELIPETGALLPRPDYAVGNKIHPLSFLNAGDCTVGVNAAASQPVGESPTPRVSGIDGSVDG